MAVLLLKFFILFLFFQKCYAVGLDYLNREIMDDHSTNATNDIEEPRRVGDDVYLNEYEDDDGVLEDDNFTLYLSRKRTTGKSKATTVSTSTSTEIKESEVQPTIPNLSMKINIFKEYDYTYDEATPLALRENYNDNSVSDVATSSNANNAATIKPKNVSLLSGLYSLEPAAALFDFKMKSNLPAGSNSTVWYVPEKYPCWELPLLYGVLGPKKNNSDVFLIYPVSLKDVIDDNVEQDTETRKFYKDVHVNKWCGMPPCYADHTLCLYPGRSLSKICYDNYRVRVPTMLKQIALVNTLNSMRNHVAKGAQDQYPYLPPATNMKQILYDYDLEKMAQAWLRQCLPGPAACAALDSAFVSQLECTKFMKHCCVGSLNRDKW